MRVYILSSGTAFLTHLMICFSPWSHVSLPTYTSVQMQLRYEYDAEEDLVVIRQVNARFEYGYEVGEGRGRVQRGIDRKGLGLLDYLRAGTRAEEV